MLGLWRYILCIMVASNHFWQTFLWWQGIYAVYCFFLISGYLMSRVLNEVYLGRAGTLNYLANRALRIYPSYLVVLGLTAIAATVFADYLHQPWGFGVAFGNLIYTPGDFSQWFTNITLLYGLTDPLAVSQTWSLRIELVFYVAMIFIVRHAWRVLAWFGLSVLYVFYQNHAGVDFWDRYSTALGTSIAFSLGALIYQLHRRYTLPGWHAPLAAAAYTLHVLVAPYLWGFPSDYFSLTNEVWRGTLGLYTNLFLGAYLLYSLVCRRESTGRLDTVGDKLGKIAYAVFLLHWVVALPLIAAGVPFENKLLFVPIAFIALNIGAVLLYCGVEIPVNRLVRDRLRHR